MPDFVEGWLEEWDEEAHDAAAVLASYMQGYDPLAKQGTLYLALDGGGGIADLAVDRSQYLDNQATGATWTFEAAPASRFNLTDGWCFEFDFTADNADTGRLFQYDCVTVASDLTLILSAGGVLTIVVNNAAGSPTLTLPGIAAGNQRFVVSWSAEANVDTTGAANALVHHLCAWNLDTGAFDKVRILTALRPAQTGAMNIWAGTTAGTNPFTGTPHGVRIGRHLLPPTVTYNDFVAALVAPTTATQTDDQGLPVASAVGFASSSAFHGPAAAWACDATKRMRHRTFSALWNECQRISTEFTNAEITANDDPWIRGAPGSNTWRLHMAYLRSYPVPPGATHLWCEVQFRSYLSAGVIPYPTGVRLYSFSKNPSDASGPALTSYFIGETITRIDSGEGSYVIKSRVPIAADADGFTWLAVGLAVDPDDETGSNPSSVRMRVQAVHVVPVVVDGPGGLGFGGGGMGS